MTDTSYSDVTQPDPPSEGVWPLRRRRPQFAELVGAVGGLLAIFGVVTLLSELVGESSAGAGAAALAAGGVVVAAYVGLNVVRVGPVASALVVVTLLGAAVPMPFIVAAQDNPSPKGAATLVLIVPTALWAFFFLAGPARRRLPYLGAALLGLWLLVGVQSIDTGGGFGASGAVRTSSASGVLVPVAEVAPGTTYAGYAQSSGQLAQFGDEEFEDDEFGGDEGPNFFEQLSPFGFFFGDTPDSLGFVSLLFGLGYLAAAVALERRGAHGGATPFVAVGNVALVLSTTLLSGTLENVGSSVYALIVGGSLIWFGSWSARRLTSWLGFLMLAGGIGGLIATITDDTVPGGLLLLLAGALTVFAATQVSGPAAVVEDDPAV